MKALISGRFDPPHPGHIRTIQKLGLRYWEVVVVILDHKGQSFALEYRKRILEEILHASQGNYTVLTNTKHFGFITKEEIDEFGCDVYCGGNEDVIQHIKSMGMRCEWVDRSYDYSATAYRIGEKALREEG